MTSRHVNAVKSLLIIFFLLIVTGQLFSQKPSVPEINSVVDSYLKYFFPGGQNEISSVTPLLDEETLFLVDIEPEGWLLVSGDKRAMSVVAFSESGNFDPEILNGSNPATGWLTSYSKDIEYVAGRSDLPESKSWSGVETEVAAKGDEVVTVAPLIEVAWNQGEGWNMFCPPDPKGPGGKVYVGCVAVAMGQAISVFKYPSPGRGEHTYFHDMYGDQYVDYSSADYNWESMSFTNPDDYNALLLYHCAVSVNMNFGPDGSSASTSNTPGALESYFMYSKNMTYIKKFEYTDQNWKNILIEQLANGRPIIYRGESLDGESAHSFNIDGVRSNIYFHLNWGWGGKNNGYYLLSALKPGTRNYSYDHGAVINMQPYYYPVDIVLSNNVIPENEAAGTEIGVFNIIDEAEDNEYNIVIECDSTFIDSKWVKDYTLEGMILKTGREFTSSEFSLDTVRVMLKDVHGNMLDVNKILSLDGSTSVKTVPDDEFGDINVYPNPASDLISINTPAGFTPESIEIYNISGERVFQAPYITPGKQVNISELNGGIYVIRLKSVNGNVVSRKLVKN